MKKTILTSLLALFALASCQEQKPLVEQVLDVSMDKLVYDYQSDEKVIYITSNNAWTIQADALWLDFSSASGEASDEKQMVKVYADENEEQQARTATVTVASGELKKTVQVTQAAAPAPEPTPEPEPEPDSEVTGTGTEADPYLLSTAAHLCQIRELAPEDAETWFELAADIDMAGVTGYVPVNYDNNYTRKINLDGKNFTIKNFTFDKDIDGANYASIFGVLYGSVKNLKIDNAKIASSNACGVLGGYVGTSGKPALVENVIVTNSTVTSKGDCTGGIAGNACEATFKNVSFQGTVNTTFVGEAKAGGIAGQVLASATFENCSSDVTISGAGCDLGGFAGKFTGEVTATGCKSKAVITSTAASKNRVGGFVGWNSTTKTVLTDCHVLEGTALTDKSGRTAASNGNYGGFIGFGDTNDTVLEITDCSATADVHGGVSNYHSCFISYLGYSSTTTIKNSHASGTLKSTLGNQTGGLLGNLSTNAKLTISGCSFTGNIDALGDCNYVGGLVGGASGVLEISTSYSAGEVKSMGQYVGGLIGASMNDNVKITNSFSAARVYGRGQQVGGLVGTTTNKLTMSNCYASGDVGSGTSGAAGLVGRVQKSSNITNCIAWNKNIHCSRTSSAVYAPGAILGCAQAAGTYANCWRRADMVFVDEFVTLYDQPDYINAVPPLPSYSKETHQQSYHGKAAPHGATLASVAQTLGWDASIWNFTSGDSALGFTIKVLGDNKIEF